MTRTVLRRQMAQHHFGKIAAWQPPFAPRKPE